MQDLTKITMQLTLLEATDPETYNALMNYKGPTEYWSASGKWCDGRPREDMGLTFRAKPQPVRGEVVMFGRDCGDFGTRMQIDTHRLTIPTIDGALIAGEYRDDAGNVIKLEAL